MTDNRSLSLANNDDFDAFDQRDRITPRLKIMQSTSKEVKARTQDAGRLVDVTGGRVICETGKNVLVTHLFFWKEWIEFNPNEGAPKAEMILNRTTDPNSALAQLSGNFMANKIMTKRGEKMKVTEIYNFILTAPEATESWEELFIFSYMKTGHKIGKQLLNRMQVMKQVDPVTKEKVKARIWSHGWQMGTETAHNAAQEEYYIPKIGNAVENAPENWAFLMELSNSLKSRRAQLEEQATASTVADVAGESQASADNAKQAEM